LISIKKNCMMLRYASLELRNDYDLVMSTTHKYNYYPLQYVGEQLKKNPHIHELLTNFLSEKPDFYYKYLPLELKEDKNITLKAVSQQGYLFEYIPQKLRNDSDIALKAIKYFPQMIQYASERLKNDYQFVLDGVKINAEILCYLSDEFKNNRNIILEAVKQNGLIIKIISEQLKQDLEIIVEAMKQECTILILDDIIDNLQNNYEKIQEKEKELLLKEIKKVILEFVKKDRNSYIHIKTKLSTKYSILSNLIDDYDIVLQAVQENGFALEYVLEEYKDNYNIVLNAIRTHGIALSYSSNNMKNNLEIVKIAIQENNNSLHYASEELQKLFL